MISALSGQQHFVSINSAFIFCVFECNVDTSDLNGVLKYKFCMHYCGIGDTRYPFVIFSKPIRLAILYVVCRDTQISLFVLKSF